MIGVGNNVEVGTRVTVGWIVVTVAVLFTNVDEVLHPVRILIRITIKLLRRINMLSLAAVESGCG